MPYERTIDEIVDVVRDSKERKGTALLIGAGCSVTAGIPAAPGVIERIKQDYPAIFDETENKTYAGYMNKLGSGHRKELIARVIADSKINWCHIAIAQLMAHGFITRVLTTNFDPLVARACALINEFPAIYDFATPPERFRGSDIHTKSVFHLHGQYTGFVLRNTPSELKDHAKKLDPLFGDTIANRPIIVVGYSGENDPVFECLATTSEFSYTLNWVCYKDNPAPPRVSERLLQDGKSAYYLQGYDSDGFFVELAQKLDCFPPTFVERPFTHLRVVLNTLAEYRPPKQDTALPILKKTLKNLDLCIEQHEDAPRGPRAPSIPQLWSDVLAGKYEQVIASVSESDIAVSSELSDIVSTAHFGLGNTLADEAKTKTGAEADRLYALASERYEASLRIKPDKHDALNNWGASLVEQAKAKNGREADRLYTLAAEKFESALRIKSDKHGALNNWGTALFEQAKTKSGKEADRLYALAAVRYESALRIKPDYYEALFNWGFALGRQAKTRTGAEADLFHVLAAEKYEAALRIKPDMPDALNNWGYSLNEQAKTRMGSEANRLYTLAIEKLEAAIRIKPDMPGVYNNWGNAFLAQAKTKTGAEADQLYSLSAEKYEAALRIKPDMPDVLNNWGNALLAQAKTKTGAEADTLYSKADTLLRKAESLSPGIGSYNLACFSSLRGNLVQCKSWLDKSAQHGKLPTLAHIERDSDLDAVRNLDWFKAFLAKHQEHFEQG